MWRTYAVTIPITDLVPGTNVVQLGSDQAMVTSNVNIVLVDVPGGVPVLPGSNNAYPASQASNYGPMLTSASARRLCHSSLVDSLLEELARFPTWPEPVFYLQYRRRRGWMPSPDIGSCGPVNDFLDLDDLVTCRLAATGKRFSQSIQPSGEKLIESRGVRQTQFGGHNFARPSAARAKLN